ncbi:ATPase [Sphingomonas panacis]|uniref:ATPase n=1 Tax=Sphingomonas panacis TaxID=1560345 RepID=A0A1B3ZE00_9SPHN|nr:type I secretion system permease/ATPase [Sphingomonas panacis]AOH85654.1 ATPase [Sphingomonas panacis]
MSYDVPIVAPKQRFAPWLLEPMRRNKAIYLKVALAATTINLLGLVSSLFTMTVYDRVVPNNATSSLIGLSIGLGIVIIFDFILRLLRAYFVDVAGAQIDHEVGETLFAKLLAIRLDKRKGSTGSLTGIMRELETLRDFFASATITAIVDVPFIVITLALIAVIGGPVVLVPLAMVPLVVLVGVLTHPAMDRLSARSMGDGLLKQSVLVETIGSLETVKASGAGGMLANRWRKAVNQHADSSLGQRLISTIAVTTATSANTMSYAGVVIVGVGLLQANEITMGGLMACSILSGRAVAPLGQIATLLSRMTATRTAYRQINGLMDSPSEGPPGEALVPTAFQGRVELRNLSFRYPGAPEKTLEGINLKIEAGERVALIGRVGSGKSTIARLLLGLYEPEDGLVLIDGTDVRQFDTARLRALMGAALQDNILFAGTVRENICLERSGIDQEEMLRVADLAGTHRFMGQIANGYDLRLTDRGEGLSGGQRQSISLARALAGKPQILVFDEPTSAMDAQTEATLIERLQGELQGRTVILITHRPSLLRLVDRVLVVEGGRIAADGPREDVMQRMAKGKAA